VGRCDNPNHSAWEHYGGRGMKACVRWSSFKKFFKDMGPRPEGMTLDRIYVNQGYRKSNCRWATIFEQANNKRERPLLEDEEEFY
jgi:hypothetical protein